MPRADDDPPGYDPVAELGRILENIGARVTFDRRSNNTRPCYLCGETTAPRTLVPIGKYTRPMGGGLQPGDPIVRPLCERCRELTEPRPPAAGDRVEWTMEGNGETQRATVTGVEANGRVHVEFKQTNTRGKRVTRTARVWFDAHEVHRLRPATPEPTSAETVVARPRGATTP